MENVPPEFVKPLADYSFKVNGRGKISVTIQSLSELKVTWFRNGKKLDPSTDPRFHYGVENNVHSLTILQIHVEDEGKWTCVAENQSISGRQASHGVIKLMIPRAYKPPEFVEPLRAILTDAGTVSLECKVTGVPTPYLTWMKDGEQIKPGDVFALKQADPTSLGSYTCRATNCMGTVVSCSHVHVTSSRPVITDGLVDHKARIGEPHVLTVGVRNPVDKVTWYNKGVEVKVDGGRISMNKSDYGVELVLNPLMLCDDGEWKCSVNGVETSCFVSVVAPKNYRKPRFLQDLKAVLTEEGLVTFECKVVGYPTPSLTWFKDGLELKPGDVYQLCGSNSLGQYMCQATNYMGVVESTAELTFDDIQFQLSEEERGKLLEHLSSVNRPPQFIKGLKSATVVIGSRLELNVELNCKATLEWYFDNQLITPESTDFIITENSLIDECLAVGREGEYKCVAKTDYGTSFSCCRISLNIPSTYKKPRFLEGLRAVLHEGIVNLECKVIGVPQPTLKWFKDGIELKAGDIHKIVSSGGNCCLGTYTCQAKNCMGSCESSASLLGFEENKKDDDILEKLARDPSLSTILEERSSQMISVYETAEGVDEISVSIDGKEVSVSLYETPDLTEQDAKNIIEMFADEYSEFVSEHNVLTLPSLRFVKETTNSGRIVMEAMVIDVDVNGFETPPSHQQDSCSEKTEADFEDMSDLSESRHSVPLEDFEAVQVGAAVELVLEKERTMTSLDSPTSINLVLSDGLKMLEMPEKEDYQVVEAAPTPTPPAAAAAAGGDKNSSSPDVSFYSEGMDTPVFGSLEELPRGGSEEDESWEIVNNDNAELIDVNNVTVKEFSEQIDQFGGKISEFLNELNKLTGDNQAINNNLSNIDNAQLEYNNIVNSQLQDDLEYDTQFHDSNEHLDVDYEKQFLQHQQLQLQQQEIIAEQQQQQQQIEMDSSKAASNKKERKDSMTQTINKKTSAASADQANTSTEDKAKEQQQQLKSGTPSAPANKNETKSQTSIPTTACESNQNDDNNKRVCNVNNENDEFEIVEHSDVSDFIVDEELAMKIAKSGVIAGQEDQVVGQISKDSLNLLNQTATLADDQVGEDFECATMTSAQINESKLDAILNEAQKQQTSSVNKEARKPIKDIEKDQVQNVEQGKEEILTHQQENISTAPDPGVTSLEPKYETTSSYTAGGTELSIQKAEVLVHPGEKIDDSENVVNNNKLLKNQIEGLEKFDAEAQKLEISTELKELQTAEQKSESKDNSTAPSGKKSEQDEPEKLKDASEKASEKAPFADGNADAATTGEKNMDAKTKPKLPKEEGEEEAPKLSQAGPTQESSPSLPNDQNIKDDKTPEEVAAPICDLKDEQASTASDKQRLEILSENTAEGSTPNVVDDASVIPTRKEESTEKTDGDNKADEKTENKDASADQKKNDIMAHDQFDSKPKPGTTPEAPSSDVEQKDSKQQNENTKESSEILEQEQKSFEQKDGHKIENENTDTSKEIDSNINSLGSKDKKEEKLKETGLLSDGGEPDSKNASLSAKQEKDEEEIKSSKNVANEEKKVQEKDTNEEGNQLKSSTESQQQSKTDSGKEPKQDGATISAKTNEKDVATTAVAADQQVDILKDITEAKKVDGSKVDKDNQTKTGVTENLISPQKDVEKQSKNSDESTKNEIACTNEASRSAAVEPDQTAITKSAEEKGDNLVKISNDTPKDDAVKLPETETPAPPERPKRLKKGKSADLIKTLSDDSQSQDARKDEKGKLGESNGVASEETSTQPKDRQVDDSVDTISEKNLNRGHSEETLDPNLAQANILANISPSNKLQTAKEMLDDQLLTSTTNKQEKLMQGPMAQTEVSEISPEVTTETQSDESPAPEEQNAQVTLKRKGLAMSEQEDDIDQEVTIKRQESAIEIEGVNVSQDASIKIKKSPGKQEDLINEVTIKKQKSLEKSENEVTTEATLKQKEIIAQKEDESSTLTITKQTSEEKPEKAADEQATTRQQKQVKKHNTETQENTESFSKQDEDSTSKNAVTKQTSVEKTVAETKNVNGVAEKKTTEENSKETSKSGDETTVLKSNDTVLGSELCAESKLSGTAPVETPNGNGMTEENPLFDSNATSQKLSVNNETPGLDRVQKLDKKDGPEPKQATLSKDNSTEKVEPGTSTLIEGTRPEKIKKAVLKSADELNKLPNKDENSLQTKLDSADSICKQTDTESKLKSGNDDKNTVENNNSLQMKPDGDVATSEQENQQIPSDLNAGRVSDSQINDTPAESTVQSTEKNGESSKKPDVKEVVLSCESAEKQPESAGKLPVNKNESTSKPAENIQKPADQPGEPLSEDPEKKLNDQAPICHDKTPKMSVDEEDKKAERDDRQPDSKLPENIKNNEDDGKKTINVSLTKMMPGELVSFDSQLNQNNEAVEKPVAGQFDVNAINPTATKVSKIELQAIELVTPKDMAAAANKKSDAELQAKNDAEKRAQEESDKQARKEAELQVAEETRKAEEEKKRVEEEKKKAEGEKKRVEEEKKKAEEEKKRVEEEKKKAEGEKKRVEEEKKRVEEEKRKAEEEKKKVEEEKKKAEEEKKKVEEEKKKAAEEKKRVEEEKKKAEEEKRVEEEKKKAEEEKKRVEEEKKKAEEEKKKVEEEKKKAEEEKKRVEEEKKKAEEEKRVEEEKKKAQEEKKRVEEEKKRVEEEKKRVEDEKKKAEEEKKKVEEEKKIAEEETKRVEEEKKKAEEEKKRVEDEKKKAEEEKKKAAEEKKVEEEKKKAEEEKKRAEEEKKKAEEEKKKAAEEKKKVEEEKKKAEEEKKKAAEEKKKVEEEKKKAEEEKKLVEDEKKKAEEEKKKAEAEKKKAEEEKKKVEEEQKKAEAERKKAEEEKKKVEEEKKKVEQEKKRDEEERKVKEEKERKETAEKKAKEEQERIEKEAAEKKTKDEAAKREKEAAEKKAKEEKEAAEKKAKDEKEAADKKAKAEAAQREKEAAEKKAKEEAAKQKQIADEKEAADKKAKEEKDAAEKKVKDEAAKREKEAADKKAKEEKEAAEKKEKEEAAKREKEVAEKKAKEEKEAAEKKAKEEAAKQQKLADEKKAADKKAKEEKEAADKKAKDEAAKLEKEAAEKKAKDKKEAEDKKATAEKEAAEKMAKDEAAKREKEAADKKAKDELERREKEAAEQKSQDELKQSKSKKSTRSIVEASEKGDSLEESCTASNARKAAASESESLAGNKVNEVVSGDYPRSSAEVSRTTVLMGKSDEGLDNQSQYNADKYDSTARRPDTGFVSGSNNSGLTRDYRSELASSESSLVIGQQKRHVAETSSHSKWETPRTSRGKSVGQQSGLYDRSTFDDHYGLRLKGDSRSSPFVDSIDSLNAYIPRRETKSASFDESAYEYRDRVKSFKHNVVHDRSEYHHEYSHTLKAREYMKSLGYYSAIEEHDHSLAGVDDLPVDSLHGYHGNSRRRPKFTIRLLDRVISSGSNLSINCSATGIPLPNLEWFKNGFPIVPDAKTKIIGGVGFGSIEIRGVEKSDQAEISCVASNSFGRARSSATVHVFDLNYTRIVMPVTFYSQMITENRTSSDIVLETFAKGHDDVIWTKDDKSIGGQSNYSTQNFPDGRCRLTIKNPKASDSGSWKVTARNRFSCNSLTKFVNVEEFSLTGFKLPIFIKGLQDLAVEIGDSVFLSVSVEGADSVEFIKSGRLRETQVNRVGSYTTFIPFVQVEDLGVYVAVAKNRHGQVESCCALRAIGGVAAIGPNFVVKPKPVYVVDVGVDLNIVVQVEGEPTPFINWYKGCRNVILENPRAYREILSPGSTRFTLKKLHSTDAGLYSLQAKNLSGVDVVQFYVQVRETRARSLTPVSSVSERRSSLQNRNRHWASVERLARSYRNSTLQSQAYSSLSRERKTSGMVRENSSGSVVIKEILPGWVSIQWEKVRGRVVGYHVHCKDINEESPQWVELAFTRLCSHEANLRPGRDYVFRITPKCKSSDDDFCFLSDPFFLSNRVMPEFTQLLPVSTTGLIGNYFSLQCQLREGVPCSITWSKDGEILDLINNNNNYKSSFSNRIAKLEFVVTDNDCGRFCCEAKNNYGRSISYTHFETTNTPDNVVPCNLDNITQPMILMEPKNRIVANGSNAVVSCQVPTNCNVEWIFNGQVITDEDENYRLTNNGKFYSLEINSVNPQLTGKYILSVSNAAGKCTSQFKIDVRKDEDWDLKPKFLNQSLNDLNVTLGEKFTLHGFVLGTGILFYVWKKDGKIIHRNRYKCYIVEHDREHANLTVQKANFDHCGHYECTVHNNHGQDTIHFNVLVSNPVSESKLKKSPSSCKKLIFKKRPEEMELEEGDSTVLEFECDGDSDNIQFKWYKDGINVRELRDSQHFTCEHIGSIYRLLVKDAKMQFSGAYKLLIKCGALSINGIVSLQVKCKSSTDLVSNLIYPLTTKPVITKDLEKDLECRFKDRVELRVEFEPNSKIFHVHWDVNGVVRTGQNFSCILLPAVEKDQRVSVRIYNSIGSCSSHSNIVISDGAPKFQRRNIPLGGNNKTPLNSRQPRFFTHLHDKVVCGADYDSVTLLVSAKSNYLTRTTWSKDNVELYNSNKFIIREDGDLKSLEITNLNSVTDDDSGIYTVTIENRFGSSSSSCYLHVT